MGHSANSSTTVLPTLALNQQNPDASGDVSTSADLTTTSLSASLGIPSTNRRILSFRSAPPPSQHATSHLDQQRSYLLHSSAAASRGTSASGPGASGVKKRVPPYVAERILDAPGFADDYYLNLIDWSCSNRVAIGLGDLGYVWDAESGEVTALGEGS
jgi:cell division cycle protein 20 (cofactor of APC complex)